MVTADGAKLSLNTSSSTVYQGVDLASVRDCSPAKLVVSGSCACVAAALTGCQLSRGSPRGEPVQARSAG
jgi:hypothetical protein